MIVRGPRLSGLMREVIASIYPGGGESTDTVKRRVATGRGLTPDSWNWNSFLTCFARSLRALEKERLVEVERSERRFQRVCATRVRLTDEGERARERLVSRSELGLGALGGELGPRELVSWERLVARARDADLDRLERLLGAERSRRAAPGPGS